MEYLQYLSLKGKQMSLRNIEEFGMVVAIHTVFSAVQNGLINLNSTPEKYLN